jgi:hypothetical protein
MMSDRSGAGMAELLDLIFRLAGAPLPLAKDLDLSFKDWSALPQTWGFIKDLAYATVAAMILWGLFKIVYRKVRSRLDDIPGRLAAEARRVLQVAMDRRSKVDVSMGTGKSAPCSILRLGDDTVTLEAPAYTKLTKDAVGKTAECFFKIPGEAGGGHWDFYRFRGEVLSLVPGQDKSKALTLTLPSAVDPGQKRRFFRLSPPRQMIPRLAAWPGKFAETKIRGLPKPNLKFKVDAESHAHLVNISAGGLLLDVDRNHLVRSGLPQEKGDTWLFLVSVQDPANEERLDWWLQANLVNVLEGNPGRLELAFRLTGFADSLEDDAPTWQPIPEEGVEVIASWVFLRSMELAREGKDAE